MSVLTPVLATRVADSLMAAAAGSKDFAGSLVRHASQAAENVAEAGSSRAQGLLGRVGYGRRAARRSRNRLIVVLAASLVGAALLAAAARSRSRSRLVSAAQPVPAHDDAGAAPTAQGTATN